MYKRQRLSVLPAGADLADFARAPDGGGLVPVDEYCRTQQPHIYAVGDVIGPPALASSAMEQGRRAVCHALGLEPGHPPELSPIGIYTIPEIATVGLDEGAEVHDIERHHHDQPAAAVRGAAGARFCTLASHP